MKLFFVYILKCADGSYYTGHTDNLEKRIYEHENSHFLCYTSNRLPIKLVFHQGFNERVDALRAERKIKGWSNEKKRVLSELGWGGMISLRNEKKRKI